MMGKVQVKVEVKYPDWATLHLNLSLNLGWYYASRS